MARPVTLFTGQWADLPLEVLAGKAKEFGYDGLELACWGDHLDIERALTTRRTAHINGRYCPGTVWIAGQFLRTYRGSWSWTL